MTREEFQRMRLEMSKIFVAHCHDGVDDAAEHSIVCLYNTLLQKLWDLVTELPGRQECCKNAVGDQECCGDPDILIYLHDVTEAITKGMIRDASGSISMLPSAGVPPIVRLHPSDGRPVGWTEAMCLEYIGEGHDGGEILATHFLHGDWYEINKHFPEFARWMNDRVNQ